MKQTLVAAVVAALASSGVQAQSVSLYGVLDMSIVSAKAPGAAASVTQVQSGNMTTSFYGFKSTESLGGGLKAEAVAEGFLRGTNGAAGRFDGDPLFSRSANVGLSGGFGSITVGRITNPLFVNNLIFNALGDSFGFSPAIRLLHLSAGQASGDTGWNEAVRVTLPRIGGASVSVFHAVKGSRPGANTNVSTLYFAGPLSLGAAWQEVRRRDGAPGSVGASDSDAWQIGAAYDLKTVKLFAQVGKVDNITFKTSYDHMGLGAAVPMGPNGKILAQHSAMEPSNAKASKTTSVAYDHFLSKRTDLYAVLMNEQVPGRSTGTSYGVGVRHRF